MYCQRCASKGNKHNFKMNELMQLDWGTIVLPPGHGPEYRDAPPGKQHMRRTLWLCRDCHGIMSQKKRERA